MQQSKFRELIMPHHESHRTRLGDTIRAGTLPAHHLGVLATQFYLQEKWPSHIAHVYLNLDDKALSDRAVVEYIIDIIKAENLGVGSDGISHSVLARRFAQSVGVTSRELYRSSPIPQNRTLMDWCDLSAVDRPWIEAFAVQIACESQVELMAQIDNGLREHYGVSTYDAAFWSVHGGPIEREHARRGHALLARYTTQRTIENVLYTYDMTCRLQAEYYNALL